MTESSVRTVVTETPTFGAILDEVESHRRTVTVCAPALPESLRDVFVGRHVTLEHRFMAASAGTPFVTVREGDEYIGSVQLPAVLDFTNPRAHELGSAGLVDAAYRKLTSLLPETVFSTLDRTQLLATSREIEDRAWRVAEGRLDAGFQSLSKLRAQARVYTALAERPALDVHVYGRPDWTPPQMENVTLHTDGDGFDRYWFLAFVSTSEPEQSCGLLAEETASGTYRGFWTYDPETTRDIAAVARTFPVRSENETENEIP